MRRFLLPSVAVVFAVLVAAAPAPAAAAAPAPGSFAGTLGVAIPKGGQGTVRAVDRATGTLAAARDVGRTGRFSLTLPAGSYVVVGTVVPVRRGAKVVQTRIGVSLKAGQKRRNTSLKARRRKAKTKARAAYVQERGQVTAGRVAVQIYDVTGTVTGEIGAIKGGINDLLITDVVSGRAHDDCGVAVLETDRLADVLKELEFQQSPYVDPSTRIERNAALGDVEVRGTLVQAGTDAATLTLSIIDKASGKAIDSIAGKVDRNSFFDDLDRISGKLNDALCKLSDVYEVTLDVAGRGDFATHAGSGQLHAVLRARRADATKLTWTDSGPLQWGDLAVSTKIPECPLVSPLAPAITWSVTITSAGDGQLHVTWAPSANDLATATVDCVPSGPGEPDPPPIPGMPVAGLLTTGPLTFTVPAAGGTQALSGEVTSDGDGFRDTGTITVKPAGVAGAPAAG